MIIAVDGDLAVFIKGIRTEELAVAGYFDEIAFGLTE